MNGDLSTVAKWLASTVASGAAVAISTALVPQLAGAQAPVGPYLDGAFPERAPLVEWGIVDAFPALEFPQAIQLVPVPGQDKLAVLVKAGRIQAVDADEGATSKHDIVDIRPQVHDRGDGGLLGMVFHPDFGVSGAEGQRWMYVYYRYLPDAAYEDGQIAYNRLSRFEVDPVTLTADPASEYVLFDQFDLHRWHSGGGLQFGTDGFLYVSVGDMGDPSVAEGSYQRLDNYLTSGVLRIDVDRDPTRSHPIRRQPNTPPGLPSGWPESYSQGYYIPDDNPWLSESGDYLEEFYAVGLRSPHRMAFDPQTQDLWLGDTGAAAYEEINIIIKGGNYQWPYREGPLEHSDPPDPLIGTDQPPVHAYLDGAVVGGFMYRGSRYDAQLGGKYLYTDYNNGTLEALTYDESSGTWEPELLTTFAENGIEHALVGAEDIGDGNVYLLGYGNPGKIFRLEPLPPAIGSVPQSLSEVGAFTDLQTLEPAPYLFEYDVNSALWSDAAMKQRWVAIPNDGDRDEWGEQVMFAEYGPWAFPAGTVFVKHFELPTSALSSARARLETRFLVITDGGSAYGLTYRWNEAGTDALLLTGTETRDLTLTAADGASSTQTWTFPSPQQCLQCHTANAGYSLGLQTYQLNRNQPGTTPAVNQLVALRDLGVFTNPFELSAFDGLPRGSSLSDASASVEARLNSYMAANCSHCHLPGAVVSGFDARFSAPLADLVGRPAEGHSSTEAFLVRAGDRDHSELFVRDSALGLGAMPPLGKSIVDQPYIDLLGDWIDALPPEGDCEGTWLSPDALTAVSASSEDLPKNPAAQALDGNQFSVWHSEWRDGFAPLPHEIVVDLGESIVVDALSYLPRQDPSVAGITTEYALYLSDSPSEWGKPVVEGTWAGDKREKVVLFERTQARYARWVALAEANDASVTVVAELGFRSSSCEAVDDETDAGMPDASVDGPMNADVDAGGSEAGADASPEAKDAGRAKDGGGNHQGRRDAADAVDAGDAPDGAGGSSGGCSVRQSPTATSAWLWVLPLLLGVLLWGRRARQASSTSSSSACDRLVP